MLEEEHPKAKPFWINESNLSKIRMYPGDRKILELLAQDSVFAVLIQYDKEKLIKFECTKIS